ncbi:MAG: 16S rRNA (cytidine(1402)-2'-O)-methyltransferase [Candidatus Hydrogenedentes bacterium]|nr:16S rRNA (cytidine(1402)-2'-O)-methyltransferase [Candidatus Hydrogenedentota bacterium]
MATGRLFVVATPIGNLEDISARALRVLSSVHVIAAEDTRHSKKLLDHFNIHTPLTSYHDHNESHKADHLLEVLRGGHDVALITDAGTPCVADPGYRVVRAAREAAIQVESVPGPSALIAALSVSGLPTDRFAFYGFFPRKRKDAEAVIAQAKAVPGTHVFYESPNRICAALKVISELAADAQICVARELTKLHEEVFGGAPATVLKHFEQAPARGECVIILHLSEALAAELSDEQIREAVEVVIETQSLSRRDAIREVAARLSIPRNRVYDAAGDA